MGRIIFMTLGVFFLKLFSIKFQTMHKYFLLFICGLLVVWGHNLLAQPSQVIAGRWQGAIELPGAKLELSIVLRHSNGAWQGFLNIPVQQVKDMPLDDLHIAEGQMRFRLTQVPGGAAFSGKFEEDFRVVRGDFTQSGLTLKMYLRKESADQADAETARLAAAVQRIRILADSFRILREVPAIAIGIVKDGEVLLAEGFGWADLENRQPATATTLFAIGSCTKAFTAAGLAILADEGRLDWDKPVQEYMPDFRLMDAFATREMTAIDLLTHQSGLPRHDLVWYGSAFSRQELFDRLRHLPPTKSFRTQWQYQNLMYLAAGVLTERISGQRWEDFTRERLLRPLGMSHTVFTHHEVPAGAVVARPYRKTGKDSVVRMPYRDISAIGPAGSIYSNVEDMLRWARLHLQGGKTGDTQVLSAAALVQLHSPRKVIEGSIAPEYPELSHRSYALGWFVYRNKDLDVVQHGGNIDGFSALTYLLPGKNIGMVFLTNLNRNPLPGILANYATDLLLGREYTDWYARAMAQPQERPSEKPKPVEGARLSRSLKDFAGRYEHPGYGIISIDWDKQDKLTLTFNDFRAELRHWHYDVFQVKFEGLEQEYLVNFQADKTGAITSLGIALEPTWNQDLIFVKLPPDVLTDSAYVATLTGVYDLNGTRMEVSFQQGKLRLSIPGQPLYELVPLGEHRFQLKGLNGYQAEFFWEKGKPLAAEMKLRQPNGTFIARRK